MHKCESQHAWTHAPRTSSSLHVKQTLCLSLSLSAIDWSWSLSVLVRRFWTKLWQDQQITTTRPNYWKNCCLWVFLFFFLDICNMILPKKEFQEQESTLTNKKTKTKKNCLEILCAFVQLLTLLFVIAQHFRIPASKIKKNFTIGLIQSS